MPLAQALISHGAYSWDLLSGFPASSLPLVYPLYLCPVNLLKSLPPHWLQTWLKLLTWLLASPPLTAFGPFILQATQTVNWAGLVFAPVQFLLPRRPSSTPLPLKPGFCGISSTLLCVPNPYCPARGDLSRFGPLGILCLRLSCVSHSCDSSEVDRTQSPATSLQPEMRSRQHPAAH